jgi:hypothetical protein
MNHSRELAKFMLLACLSLAALAWTVMRYMSSSKERNGHVHDPVPSYTVVAKRASLTTLPDTSAILASSRIDWSVPLGNGTVAAYQSPAQYISNLYALPDCVRDYVVFALNVSGKTNGQANLLGLNKLYSGSRGNSPCGTVPHVNWAYNGSTADGEVLTSPVISLDGSKIAYVESAKTSSIFHVLTWKAGEGTSATAAAVPVPAGNCSTDSSCLASVKYSEAATATRASPYIDYSRDKAFMAGDDGTIYRISCAFTCPLNTNPTIDWSFRLPVAGTGGSIAQPTGVIYNDKSDYLIVTDSLGELWTINAGRSTPSVAFGPLMIGGGGCNTTNPPGRTGTPNPCSANGNSYGVASNSVILDDRTGMIYAFSGNDGTPGASAVVVQAPQTLTSQVRVHVGLGSVGNVSANVDLHRGDFDNKYWSSTPSSGHLILCGTSMNDTSPWQYWIGFAAYPVMNSVATQGIQQNVTAGIPCTDYTESYNPKTYLLYHSHDHDLLAAGLIGSITKGKMITYDISFDAHSVPELITLLNYPGGISDVIVDNAQLEESSLYFSTLGVVNVGSCSNAHCAIKLSQLNLERGN